MEITQNLLPLDTLLAQLPGWVFVADLEGHIVAASPALRELLGPMTAGERVHSRMYPDDLAAFGQIWDQLQPGAAEVSVDCRLRGKDQTFEDARCRLRRGQDASDGQVFGVIERCVAIRNPGARDADSFTHESYLRVITEHLPLIIWAVDRKGIFTLHKGKELKTAGLMADQFLGQNIFELYGDGPTIGDVRRALDGEMTHSANDMHGISWEHWILPLTDRQGVPHGAVGCSLNVTESKRIERELQSRLSIIQEQQRIISSLSTPIIQVWDQVLTLPIFGNVDSERASSLMDNLLREVMQTRAQFAILDLTGVEVIDTMTAGHLVTLIRALRLLGTEGIITGIKARIAQTVVGLGVDLTGITTLSTLQSALQYCMQRLRAKS